MVKANSLTYRYHGARSEAISDLSFELAKGSFGLVEGGVGSGKSTLLRLLTAQNSPTTGELAVGDQDLSKITSSQVAKYRRSLGMLTEHLPLILDRTVSQNIALPLELADVSQSARKTRLLETIHRFGLEAIKDEFPQALSAGEQRKVMLARALVNDPLLLIADEPTLALDPAASSAVWDLLFREHQRGMTILVAVAQVPDDPRIEKCLRFRL